MSKRILVDSRHEEEKRIAIVEDGRLIDFYVEVSSANHLKGNIYKGVVKAVERGLNAAFVDFGIEKHGFLPLKDIMPESYARKAKGKEPRINEVIDKGQEIMVQVEHDQRGTKGASLTNRISLAGRYLVMIPGRERLGVSRKIEDKDTRARLKDAFTGLKVPKIMGFILRTAGSEATTEDLAADLKYLTKLWGKIKRDGTKAKGPTLIYKEEDIAVRTVRDFLDTAVEEVIVDSAETQKNVRNFLKLTMPWREVNLTQYVDATPIFTHYGVESQIVELSEREVRLPSGGSIVIDKAEALTAIDVNTSRARGSDIESLALQTNLEAADEVMRQLRLRDIGGLIVVDFIDLFNARNYQKIEDKVRASMKADKAHFDMLKISKFGMLEMSRERMRASYMDSSMRKCPACGGSGAVRSPELVAVAALRRVHTLATRDGIKTFTCRLPIESANHVMNNLRSRLLEMEKELGIELAVLADPVVSQGQYLIDQDKADPKPQPVAQKQEKPEAAQQQPPREGAEGKKRRRRRKRKGSPEAQNGQPPAASTPVEKPAAASSVANVVAEVKAAAEGAPEAPRPEGAEGQKKGKRRRSRRGGRRRKRPDGLAPQQTGESASAQTQAPQGASAQTSVEHNERRHEQVSHESAAPKAHAPATQGAMTPEAKTHEAGAHAHTSRNAASHKPASHEASAGVAKASEPKAQEAAASKKAAPKKTAKKAAAKKTAPKKAVAKKAAPKKTAKKAAAKKTTKKTAPAPSEGETT